MTKEKEKTGTPKKTYYVKTNKPTAYKKDESRTGSFAKKPYEKSDSPRKFDRKPENAKYSPDTQYGERKKPAFDKPAYKKDESRTGSFAKKPYEKSDSPRKFDRKPENAKYSSDTQYGERKKPAFDRPAYKKDESRTSSFAKKPYEKSDSPRKFDRKPENAKYSSDTQYGERKKPAFDRPAYKKDESRTSSFAKKPYEKSDSPRQFNRKPDNAKYSSDTQYGERKKPAFDRPTNPIPRVEKKIAELMEISKEEANELIIAGRVKVNGEVVRDLSLRVTYEDEIHVNNRLTPNKKIPLKVYVFHKPIDYIVTTSDPQGRKTVFDIIPPKLGKLITVGRLDINSEGLLLLTNNGDFARMMELPETSIQRVYRVRVFGNYNIEKLQALEDGIEIEGIKYGRIFIKEEKRNSDSANKWLLVTLYEGKNREIRKVMQYFGLQVNRLIRLSYGRYNLGSLLPGCVKEVKPIMNNSFSRNTNSADKKFGSNKKRPFNSPERRSETKKEK